MNVLKSLSHSHWDCKYHVVFVPKGWKKTLYGKICKYFKLIYVWACGYAVSDGWYQFR